MSPTTNPHLQTRYIPPETALTATKLTTQALALLIISFLLALFLSLLLCWCCCQRRIWRYRARRIARQKQEVLDMEAYSSLSSKPYSSQKSYEAQKGYISPLTRSTEQKVKIMEPSSWGNVFKREERRGGPVNMVLNPRIHRGNAKFYAPGLNRESERGERRDGEGKVMSRYEVWKADGGKTRPIEKPKRVFFGGRW